MDKPSQTLKGDPFIKDSCHANPKYIDWANERIIELEAEVKRLKESEQMYKDSCR